MTHEAQISKKALDKIIKARTSLVIGAPFYGCLSLYLELEEADRLQTMATDGEMLLYNSKFVMGLTDDELIGVMAHEVSHCAYKHMTRIGHRDHVLWNIAGDFRINGDLLEQKFTLPEGRLHDTKYNGMSTEEIYSEVESDPAIKKMMKSLSSDGFSDPGGCGGVTIPDGVNKVDAKQEVETKWDVIVRQAVAVAKNMSAGNLPAHLKRLIGELNAPRVDWRDLTRRFIDNNNRFDYTWNRPNRRFIGQPFVLPGQIPDGMHHVVVFLDTSGSIWGQPKLLKEFASEIAAVLDEGITDRITVVSVDTEVHKVDEFYAGDLLKLEPMGGGGTDFTEAFKWMSKNAPEPSCVIYFTDMYTCSFGHDPGVPVLWAVYSDKKAFESLAAKAPFGESVWVA